MENERSNFRATRSSRRDDPFRDFSPGSFSASDDAEDSIFSVSRTSGSKPAAPALTDYAAEATPGVVPSAESIETAPSNADLLSSGEAEPALQPVQDAVLEALAATGLLRYEHMALVAAQLKGLPTDTIPWRAALSVPDLPHDAILQTAARMHGVPAVDLDAAPGAMLLTALMSLPPYFLQACDELRLLPFGFELDMEKDGLTLKLASSDPLRPEVGSMLEALETPVRLYYAPNAQLVEAVRHLAAYEYPAQS
jgi:hypothetical protein